MFSKHVHAVDTKPHDSTKQTEVAFSHCLQHKSDHCCSPEHYCYPEHWNRAQVIVCCSKAKKFKGAWPITGKGACSPVVQRRMPWETHDPDSPLRSQGWRCRCAT